MMVGEDSMCDDQILNQIKVGVNYVVVEVPEAEGRLEGGLVDVQALASRPFVSSILFFCSETRSWFELP